MDASYRLGLAIVLGTITAASALCLAGIIPNAPPPPRAAHDLQAGTMPLGSFRFTERSGRTVTDADLAGAPWVASFIFTRCPLSCPRISTVMKGLQSSLAGTSTRLVSVSVDPDRDTPAVLAEYARGFGADPERWWFLSGTRPEVESLVTGRFKLGLQANPGAEPGTEEFTHSDRFALVAPGNSVVGYFDSNDPKEVRALVEKAKALARPAVPGWVRRLPAVNASLNGTCAVLLMIGWVLIRSARVQGHAACMIASVAVSSVFLTCYLVYHFQVGSVPFRGTGPVRLVYFTILYSHTLLATFGVVPLVTLTLARALRREFQRHARIARVTFPIWLYVSVTGVVIYGMLYQMPLKY